MDFIMKDSLTLPFMVASQDFDTQAHGVYQLYDFSMIDFIMLL